MPSFNRNLFNKKYVYFVTGLSSLFLIIFCAYKWQNYQLKKEPNRDVLIQKAIDSIYGGVYRNLDDLQKDYPSFTPNIRRWSDDTLFFLGQGLYATSMPEEEVITDFYGEFHTTRICGANQSACTLTPIEPPRLGIIGIVRSGTYNDGFIPATEFNIRWEGKEGVIKTNGNCFVAYKESKEPLKLIVEVPDHRVVEIHQKYGYRLYRFNFLDDERISKGPRGFWTGTGGRRISKDFFDQLKECDEQLINDGFRE